MVEASDASNNRRWLLWSSLYAAVVIIIGGILNYIQPYSPEPWTRPPLWAFLLWLALYLPAIILPLLARQKVIELGFHLNSRTIIASILAMAICTPMVTASTASWSGAAFEAFARTGEEVFFRGFLFFLFARLFERSRRPWLPAVLLSSLLFTMIHTYTFQPDYLRANGSATNPVWSIIQQQLMNVFFIALAFSLVRAWTGSVLPGALAHSLSGGGILALPAILLIYFAYVGWALLRGEPLR